MKRGEIITNSGFWYYIKHGAAIKRVTLIAAVVLMLAGSVLLFSGCGGDDSSGSSSNTTDTQTDGTGGEPPGDMGGDGSNINKTGVYEQDGGTVEEEDKTYAATQTDESAVYVYGGGTYTLTGTSTDMNNLSAQLTKTGDSSSVNDSNFYGNNAIVLAEDGSIINLNYCELTSDSDGSNGVFAYEKGSVVNVANCAISTTGNSARGVDATYGGTINISDSYIITTGAHCSALATDRYDTASGAPAVNAYRVTAEVDGDGSCGIYSTGTFYVEDCILIANGSGCAVIEGTNSITLVNTDLTTTDEYSSEDKYGVMVYQSMSGDALGNTGTFDMEGGSITVDGGPILLNTNDEAYFTLEDIDLSGSDLILHTGKINWHAEASNGGISHLTTYNQAMAGDFKVDGYGNIEAVLSDGSSLVGAIDPDNSTNLNSSGTEGGYVSLTLDATSTWNVTADSYVDELIDADGTYSNIAGAKNVYVTGYSGSNNVSLAGGGTLYLP